MIVVYYYIPQMIVATFGGTRLKKDTSVSVSLSHRNLQSRQSMWMYRYPAEFFV